MNNKPQFIDVKGAQVMDLTPDYERPLALVDLDVLKKLTSLLNNGNLDNIISDFKITIDDCYNMEAYVKCLSEELAFQTTVNLIQEVAKNDIQILGKIDLEGKDCY
mgnify:CR=1 FL=1|tara:strand:+ start:371 stop:688 length:318 start_codon:yes stop_codon:yes gene_type:complete